MREDARRFGFCVRCLKVPDPGDFLSEHHLDGRSKNPIEVAFICRFACHDVLHQLEHTPLYKVENDALRRTVGLLVTSASLHWVIRNRAPVIDGFERLNRNGPDAHLGPSGIAYSGPHGAIGLSGQRYYFVPTEHADDTVIFPDAQSDGIGGGATIGPFGGGGWARFQGKSGGVLNGFIQAHHEQRSPFEDLQALAQDT